MIVDGYTKDGVVGEKFRRIIQQVAHTVQTKNDDYILPIVGLTGTGKSRLGLHVQSIVCRDPRIEQIALTRGDMAQAVMRAAKSPRGDRYLQYDEGKLSRRDWNSEWSRDLLGLYHDCRGLNIFHVWCTAYPDLLDRVFIKERVGGLIYIYTKDKDKPRLFLFFTKRELLAFLEQNGRITTDLLKKYGKSHAFLQSWFRDYSGPMAAAYEEKKEDRMMEVVTNFHKRWSELDGTPKGEVAREIGITDKTLNAWLDAGFMQADQDFVMSSSGRCKITAEGRKKLFSYAEMKKNKLVNYRISDTYRLSDTMSRLTQYSNARKPKRAIGRMKGAK